MTNLRQLSNDSSKARFAGAVVPVAQSKLKDKLLMDPQDQLREAITKNSYEDVVVALKKNPTNLIEAFRSSLEGPPSKNNSNIIRILVSRHQERYSGETDNNKNDFFVSLLNEGALASARRNDWNLFKIFRRMGSSIPFEVYLEAAENCNIGFMILMERKLNMETNAESVLHHLVVKSDPALRVPIIHLNTIHPFNREVLLRELDATVNAKIRKVLLKMLSKIASVKLSAPVQSVIKEPIDALEPLNEKSEYSWMSSLTLGWFGK